LKTLLILGASGFFGKSIIDYTKIFGLKKWQINRLILVSRKKIFFGKNIKKIKFSYIRKNIEKFKLLPKVDYIFYFINEKNQKKSFRSFKKFKYLIKNVNNKTTVLFVSSGAVYGLIKNKNDTMEKKKINIRKIYQFKNYKKKYALYKYKMEKNLKKINNKNLNIVIARCFTFIGNEILKRNSYAISNFVNSASIKKKIYVKTPLSIRSYMNPFDLSEWLLEIVSKSKSLYEVFNVGSDYEVSMKKLSQKIHKKYELKSRIIMKNNNKKDYYVPNIKKAKMKFGLKNRFSLDKSLDDLLNI
tara:strand:+ start:1965 stop:2867 length:903 start_codon:yes stop_codon:yes gene_type:complete